jgi:hypothetical protein
MRALAFAALLFGCGRADDAARPDAGDASVPPFDEGVVNPAEPPLLPVSFDAFRLWDRWPHLRIGARTYMRSTFDRTGHNRAADAAHYLRKRADTYVPLDVAGAGVLHFVRTNHWHGSPWHYGVDGRDTVVSETTTANPDKPVVGSTFIPTDVFPEPLAFTWSTTKGADLSWVPVPFTKSFELGYERAFYGTGYYIFSLYDASARLSRPIDSWDAKAPPGDVLELLRNVRGDIGQPSALEGERTIRTLRLTIPKDRAALGHERIRITWDDRAEPSVDAPIALFFGAGTLFNRDAREYLVRSMPSTIRYSGDSIILTSSFPMPFFSRAKIEVPDGVKLEVLSEPLGAQRHVGYFHATFRDHPSPVPSQDLVLLDTRSAEGSDVWCGHFVGTSFQFSDAADLTTLEGDPRFFFDDSQTPQGMGTGTEEWAGGGDYWGGQTMTLPFAGHPTGAPSPDKALNAEDKIESAYRFLLSDLMPFGRNAVIRLEHGAENQSVQHYKTVTFWYGKPRACLVQTDALHVGDVDDETKHKWSAVDATPPETLESRYEWGIDWDRFKMVSVYPPSSDIGRSMKGQSEMTLQIDPQNFGVMLRRKFDQSFVDQRAEVWVAGDGDFEKIGEWYFAGSNTALFGWTPGTTETLNAPPEKVTSNRRWREEEFIIPRRVTRGRSAIRVRIVPIGTPQPLLPGEPAPERVWSAFRYTAYSWVLPE